MVEYQDNETNLLTRQKLNYAKWQEKDHDFYEGFFNQLEEAFSELSEEETEKSLLRFSKKLKETIETKTPAI